ncbi:MAG: SusC/RagA family TonB-linked outer membrane protein [Paludibacteraceae bacterium]
MQNIKQKILSVLLLCGISLALTGGIAQTAGKTVSGKVVDTNGDPLVGVSVLAKGTSIGTVTNATGNYQITLPVDKKQVLLFSFIGYISREVVASGQILDVVLNEASRSLDEVVVIGYGSQTKKEVTGSVAGIQADEFNKGNINNPAQLMQGKVAGLSIVGAQGNPNGSYTIRLRGLSTLGANTQPLVIIDGVIGADLNSVDPSDIASMDVLKDGAAASIYGTRGSSGVILITTKSGKKGKVSLEYNGYLSSESKDRYMQVMDRDTYVKYGGTDLGGNTNWMDEITRIAFSHVHNLSMSGGSDKTTYRASINYRDVEGILLNTGYKQLNGRINLVQKMFNDRLTLNLNLAATSKDAQLGFDDAFRCAIIMPPSAPIYSDESYYTRYGGYYQSEVLELYNPLATIKQNINDQKTTRIMYNMVADYTIWDNLVASVRYARNNDNWMNGQYISKYSRYGDGVNRNGLATRSTTDTRNDLFEMTGRYMKELGKLNVTALAGYSYQNFTTERFQMQGGNFLTDAFTYNNFAAAKDFTDGKGSVTSDKENNKLIAFFGRVNANYDNTYFLSASLRHEGSTRFGDGNKWGNFPGISAGVDLRRLVVIPKVEQLKVRASYGVTGALPDQSYVSQQLYGPGTSPTYFLSNGVFTPVYAPLSNPNSDLKWETKSEVDLGFDFRMFNSRLTGTFDYYHRKTTGALITLNVPVPPNLYKTTLLNAGELINQGVELSLDYMAVKTQKFSWNPQITFSTFSSKVGSLSIGDIKYGVREVGGLPAPLTGNVVRVEEGKQIGQIIGWIYEGVDENGQYIFKNLDDDPAINDKDVAVIGRGLPKWEMGWTNTFTYGNFDLNFVLRSVYGHNLINLSRTMFEQLDRISGWNLVQTKYFDPTYKGKAAYNSYYVEDASFLKLDNLSVGYNIKMPAKSAISTARVYVTGQNLFYITGYSGVDPEVRYSYDNNVLSPGVEPLNSWVTTRTFTFGVNLTF